MPGKEDEVNAILAIEGGILTKLKLALWSSTLLTL